MTNIELMRIMDIQHIRDREIIWENHNIGNVLHLGGEQFLLQALFTGGPLANSFIPINYYFGLDNRTSESIVRDQTMNSLIAEPSFNGYARQAVSSTTGFQVIFNEDDEIYRAVSSIITFRGSGPSAGQTSWGPVQSLFLTTTDVAQTSVLIASAHLGSTITVQDGDLISMRMAIGLRNREEVLA